MSSLITLAMPKGRIFSEALALLTRANYDLSSFDPKSRKLSHDVGPFRLLVVRTADVPTYVERGVADAGVIGSDVLEETPRDLYQPIDLGIAKCRMVVAEPKATPVPDSAQLHLRVATKYPNITKRYFQSKGRAVDVIKLSGSVELGPNSGLSHQIVDLVESGETMRQNGLVEVAHVMDVSSRLVVNPARLKLRHAELNALIERLEAQL